MPDFLKDSIFIKGYRFPNQASISFSLNFHDIWIGCYWKRKSDPIYQRIFSTIHLYICIIPCIVIHFTSPGRFTH